MIMMMMMTNQHRSHVYKFHLTCDDHEHEKTGTKIDKNKQTSRHVTLVYLLVLDGEFIIQKIYDYFLSLSPSLSLQRCRE